jgi:NAD(P)-dependent dehydrogenase (short-subunit alcohol dehydrogenase family)
MTDSLFDLTGKVALVTGGSRGLGREMVLAFADHGADVIIVSRKLEACEEVAGLVRAKGRRALAISAHCGRWDEIDQAIAKSYEAFGRIDILVNNAGLGPACPSEDVSEQLFDSVVNLNFKGPFRFASQIGSRMARGDGGCIINISSTGGARPLPGIVPYAASKAALNNMSLSLAHEFAPKVRVNTLSAGAFLTDMAKSWGEDAQENAHNALQRAGQPHEIVTSALYLASPASSYTTGTMLRCDGGTW